ncbi:hypothetical protein FOA43_001874 [Brettanomyces nanus]|uniref:Zn(2)-C6 fungal-type domain-containing protein n=1 Tax=Eeniella nana TaxID=13502 RepID=A0A875S0W0_EENNA|nr:uncharacterized protein FOA43_001874 [Brettanomyces nanus]QPG74543.1 hypothetical protein FOA43_001874 [Brettanomyces nanus]
MQTQYLDQLKKFGEAADKDRNTDQLEDTIGISDSQDLVGDEEDKAKYSIISFADGEQRMIFDKDESSESLQRTCHLYNEIGDYQNRSSPNKSILKVNDNDNHFMESIRAHNCDMVDVEEFVRCTDIYENIHPFEPTFNMKQKRKTLVCTQCSKRKVKCNKEIPCSNCVRRKEAYLCRRPFENDNMYHRIRRITGKVENSGSFDPISKSSSLGPTIASVGIDQPHTDIQARIQARLRQQQQQSTRPTVLEIEHPSILQHTRSPLLSNASIENYMSSLRSLTFGYTHMNGLLPPEESMPNGSKESSEWTTHRLRQLMSKMTYRTSYLLCSFACKYTTFLHYGVVDQLFMEDHERFWKSADNMNHSLWEVVQNYKENKESTLDVKYWLSLYYAMLCVGVYFSVDRLSGQYPYTTEEMAELPRTLFKASLECLEETRFVERADIRTIQIYCVLTTCLHALGNVYIHKQLLSVVVGIAKALRLDRVPPDTSTSGKPNFYREVSRRLWYSFFIVDSVSNVPRRLIGEFTTAFPRLISTSELLGETPEAAEGAYYAGFTSDCKIELPSPSDDISGLLYERLMAEMSQIKQDSYRERYNLDFVSNAWCRMISLRDRLNEYFGSEPYTELDNSISQFAKYLLFSSLERECLGLGARLLTLTSRQFWLENFRAECLRMALELVGHDSLNCTPAYYKKYWIVGQHLIYACLFVLLDMLMFDHENCQENMKRIKDAIPTVRSLRSTHYTVRVGLAVIEKLYYLVGSVRLRHRGHGTVEEFSLREFLGELEVANPGYRAASTHEESSVIMPLLGKSQYLRSGVTSMRSEETRESKGSTESFTTSIPDKTENPSATFLDPELDSVLDDTGWKEFLGFFFGKQEASV